jgi:hypothetical protein
MLVPFEYHCINSTFVHIYHRDSRYVHRRYLIFQWAEYYIWIILRWTEWPNVYVYDFTFFSIKLMSNSMGIIIQNIGNIVVSDRKSGLFSDIQTGLALSKWPPIVLKFCMVVSQSANFNIHPVLEESKILRYMVILPISTPFKLASTDFRTIFLMINYPISKKNYQKYLQLRLNVGEMSYFFMGFFKTLVLNIFVKR